METILTLNTVKLHLLKIIQQLAFGKNLHKINCLNKIKNQWCDSYKKKAAHSRPFWQLGRVGEIFRREDKILSACIKRVDGALVTHRLRHLYPLRLTLIHNSFPLNPEPKISVEKILRTSHQRPKVLRTTQFLALQQANSVLDPKEKQKKLLTILMYITNVSRFNLKKCGWLTKKLYFTF